MEGLVGGDCVEVKISIEFIVFLIFCIFVMGFNKVFYLYLLFLFFVLKILNKEFIKVVNLRYNGLLVEYILL